MKEETPNTYQMINRRFFNVLAVALFSLSALTLSSCFGDDDDDDNNWLDQQEQKNAQLSVSGTHSGKMLYNTTDKDGETTRDTINASWTVNTDSTLVIHNFPLSQLGDNVNDEDVKAAIQALPNTELKCQYYAVTSSPVQCIVNPFTVQRTVNIKGVDRKLQFVFAANNGYSFMQYVTINNKQTLGLQILYYTVYIDDVEQTTEAYKAFAIYQE